MFQTPLKRSKFSNPSGFSNYHQQNVIESNKPYIKYDKISFQPKQNPQQHCHKNQEKAQINKLNHKSMQKYTFGNQSQNSEINDHKFENINSKKEKANILENLHNKNSQIVFQFPDDCQMLPQQSPLQSRSNKLHQRVQIDKSLLLNPRFQIDLNQNCRVIPTLQTIKHSEFHQPTKNQRNSRVILPGGIKHQDFTQYQIAEFDKQNPLKPQNPFQLSHRSTTRNSLLNRLNINRVIQQGTKRPMHRANSSFQVGRNNQKANQKIIYMNTGAQNFGSNKNVPLNNLPNLFSKSKRFNPSQNSAIFESQFQKSFMKNKHHGENNLEKDKNQNQIFNNNKDMQDLKEQINQKIAKKAKQVGVVQRQDQRRFSNEKQRQFTFNDQQKIKNLKLKKLEITYHVSLPALKTLINKYIHSPNSYSLAFKIPKIFTESELFPSKHQSQQQLHQNSLYLFESLKISSKNLITKRYSNCILFISGHVVMMWHFNGKRYLGGWQYDYLDEGSRHGLGLEWEPNKYIYYGQFKNNKKHGLGAIKKGPHNIAVGYWNSGKYIGRSLYSEQHQQSIDQRNFQEGVDETESFNEAEYYQ